jgi:hypothetical protein
MYVFGSSLTTVAEEVSEYNSDWWEYRSNETEVAPDQQVNIHFSMERGMRIMNSAQDSSYIRESYRQLRGYSLLVIGCRT